MRKLIVALTILLALGGGWYVYKTQIEIHPYIKSCSELVKSHMKSPSSYKLRKATMYVASDNSDPFILIEYEASNSFGAIMAENALFNFCYQNPLDNSNKILKTTKMVYGGKSPFEFMNVCYAEIGGRKLKDSELYSIQIEKLTNSKSLSRQLPGKVTFVDEAMNISGGMLVYNPDKFLPYE